MHLLDLSTGHVISPGGVCELNMPSLMNTCNHRLDDVAVGSLERKQKGICPFFAAVNGSLIFQSHVCSIFICTNYTWYK